MKIILYGAGTSGRNYMSKYIFGYLANRSNLTIISQKIIDWGGTKDLDCITLIRK